MNVSMVYRCKNCNQSFRECTCIEPIYGNLAKQLEVSEKDEFILDTITGGTYPLKVLHKCNENEYGIGAFIKLEAT